MWNELLQIHSQSPTTPRLDKQWVTDINDLDQSTLITPVLAFILSSVMFDVSLIVVLITNSTIMMMIIIINNNIIMIIWYAMYASILLMRVFTPLPLLYNESRHYHPTVWSIKTPILELEKKSTFVICLYTESEAWKVVYVRIAPVW